MRVNLSIRMRMFAQMVDAGARVSDIGCDHGYVAMWLASEKNCRVIATDVKEGPLAIAKRNIAEAKMSDRIDLRLGDGFGCIEAGEIDTAVIAGMGGMLICEILSAGKSVIDEAETLVLQPQSDVEAVRRHIHRIGYRIDKESICLEDGKYYFALRAVKGEEEIPYSDTEYRHSRLLAEEGGSVYRSYIKNMIDKYTDIVKKISDIPIENISDDSKIRGEELLTELEDMKKLF